MAEVRVGRQEANGGMPAACACCGKLSHHFEPRTLTTYPLWPLVLLPLGILPALIAALIVTRRAAAQIPLCPDHQNHWEKRVGLTGGSFMGVGIAIAMLVLAAPNAVMPWAWAGSFVLLVGWLVFVAMLDRRAIRAQEISAYEIVLTNVAQAFVDAVASAEKRRQRTIMEQARDQRLDEEDEAEPRQSSSDAIRDPSRHSPPDAIEE